MQYKRILAVCVTAISLAIIPTSFSSPTTPFYQQEAYATHLQCPPGFTAPHVDGEPVGPCTPDDLLQHRCDLGAPFDECARPPPLTEQFKNQGQCIKDGVDKDACKAAFKAD
jgi:hypothetical protein